MDLYTAIQTRGVLEGVAFLILIFYILTRRES